jgi:hypothetical protein
MVQLPPGSSSARELRVSGRKLPTEAIESPIAVTPGQATILVHLDDGSVREQTVVLESGQEEEVDFEPKSEPPAATPAPPPAAKQAPAPLEPPAQPQKKGSGLRTAAYIAGGVGALGAAGFAVFGLLDRAAYHDLEDACSGGQCPSDSQSDIDAGKRYQLLANVSLGVGALGLAAGTVLFVLSTPKEKSTASVSVRLRPSAISVEGNF